MQYLRRRRQILSWSLLPRLVLVAVVIVDGSARGWEAEEVSPEELEDEVGGAEAVAFQERVERPRPDRVGEADPGAGFFAEAVAGAKEEGQGEEGEEDGFFVDLVGEEEEGEGGGGQGVGEEVGVRAGGDEEGGGQRCGKGEVEGEAGEGDEGGGDVGELVDGVEAAPEVGDFVFEEAAGEGEDAVDGLG